MAVEDHSLGYARFELHGEKLRGAYALTRVGGSGSRERWILVDGD